ncbi:MAG TPA: DUF2892 domain-containing protein [Polyangiaceae bacterium]
MQDQSNGIAPHHDRVRDHTAPKVNERIDALTRASIDRTLNQGPSAIEHRLAELDEEWDIDRALMVNFAVAGGLSFAVGLARYANSSMLGPPRKGMLYFFGAQLSFLLLHGLVGWCPPASLFRRLGLRTKGEIEAERHVLLQRRPPSSDTPPRRDPAQ